MALLTAKQRGWTWLRESQCGSPDLGPKVFFLANCKLSTWRDVAKLLRFIYRDVLARELEKVGSTVAVTEMALGPMGFPVPPMAAKEVLDAAHFAQEMLRKKADRLENLLHEAYAESASPRRQAYTSALTKLAISRAVYDEAGLSRDWAPWVPVKRRGIDSRPKPGVYDVELQDFDRHRRYPPKSHVRIWFLELSAKRRPLCAYQQFGSAGRVVSWIMEGTYWIPAFLELIGFTNELISGQHDLLTARGRRHSRIAKCPTCGLISIRLDARVRYCRDRCADAARYKRRKQRKKRRSR